MAEEIMEHFIGRLSEISLLPSSGGVFEVTVNDELIFSKKELDRFPENLEISNLIKESNLF